jgi:hypothetical protein
MGKIYDSPTWGTVVRRIENDGLVYDGIGMFASCIGRVDTKGYVYLSEKSRAMVESTTQVYSRVVLAADARR